MELKPAKKLGFGLMRLPKLDPNDSSKIDLETTCKMVDRFLEQGFTYFDTAWMYMGHASENAVKTALVDRHPRESFTVATKLHNSYFNSLEDRDKVFDEQLAKTGAGYFDYYLLHGIEAGSLPHYEKYDCFDWMLKKREQGLVRHVGFSFHDTADLLDDILTRHPQMEFVQLQINYLDWESEWIQSRKCYEVCCRHGVPVVVMEPVKGGSLANVPEEAATLLRELDAEASIPSWAIRFVASLPNVMCVLSGMTTMEQLEDNTSYMAEFRPLTDHERETCLKVADVINAQIAVPCTACRYCTEGCPMQIAIPDYFSLFNEDSRGKGGWTINFSYYKALNERFGKASDCIGCGQCESVCPQHLPIIEYLRQVADHYE